MYLTSVRVVELKNLNLNLKNQNHVLLLYSFLKLLHQYDLCNIAFPDFGEYQILFNNINIIPVFTNTLFVLPRSKITVTL